MEQSSGWGTGDRSKGHPGQMDQCSAWPARSSLSQAGMSTPPPPEPSRLAPSSCSSPSSLKHAQNLRTCCCHMHPGQGTSPPGALECPSWGSDATCSVTGNEDQKRWWPLGWLPPTAGDPYATTVGRQKGGAQECVPRSHLAPEISQIKQQGGKERAFSPSKQQRVSRVSWGGGGRGAQAGGDSAYGCDLSRTQQDDLCASHTALPGGSHVLACQPFPLR